MIYTLSDIRPLVCEFIDGGVCSTHPKVLARVNEAQRRLVQTGDYNYTLDRIRFRTQNNSVTLPREYIAARMVNIDNVPAPIQGTHYDFLETGPGEWSWDNATQLVDMGRHPVFFDPPSDEDYPCRLWAVSTHEDDTALSIGFRGRGLHGSDLLNADGRPDITLAISHWNGGSEGSLTGPVSGYTDDVVRAAYSIRLPAGRKGYVSLYAYFPDAGKMWFMAKYHPSETMPGYRRYRLPVFDKTNSRYVNCLCKKQHVPLSLDTDVLLVQNLDAMKLMVQAIEAENIKDLNGSMAYKQMAVANLQTQQANENKGNRYHLSVQTDGVSNGYGLNLI